MDILLFEPHIYRRLAMLSVFLVIWALFSGGWFQLRGDKDIAQGNRLYENGDYEGAFTAYKRALLNSPDDPLLRFNAGVAAYKKGDYEGASRLFKEATTSDDPGLKASAHYNLGNSLYRLGEAIEGSNPEGALSHYKEALESYREAIKLDPEGMDAKYNYQFLERKIKELEEKLQKEREEGSGGNEPDQKMNAPRDGSGDDDQEGTGSQGDPQNDKDVEGNMGEGGDTSEGQGGTDQEEMRDRGGNGGNEDPQGNSDGIQEGEGMNPSDALITPEEGGMTREEAIMLLEAARAEEVLSVPRGAQRTADPYIEKDW